MQYVIADYAGIELEIPLSLYDRWPFDLPLDLFPTFCGPGKGIGDFLVPDSIFGAHLNPACLIHDHDWAFLPKTWPEFTASNGRFLRNSNACIDSQLHGVTKHSAKVVAALYYISVMCGWEKFASNEDYYTRKLKSSTVESKIILLNRTRAKHFKSVCG